MIVIIYLLLLLSIYLWGKKRSIIIDKYIVSYNFLFLFVLYMFIQCMAIKNIYLTDLLLIFFYSIKNALRTMMFDPQIIMLDNYLHILGDSKWVEIQIWIIAAITFLCAVKAVIIITAYKWFNQMKFKIKRLWAKEQYVVIGSHIDTVVVIEELLQLEDNSLLIYLPDNELNNRDNLYSKALILDKNGLLKLLNKLNKLVQYNFIIMPHKDWGDVDILDRINLAAIEQKIEKKRIKATVLMNSKIQRFFPLDSYVIDTYINSKEKLLSYKLLEDKPLFNICVPQAENCQDYKNYNIEWDEGIFPILLKPFTLCIIGFGKIGREYLLTAFENSAFITKENVDSFKGIVIDRNIDKKASEFVIDVPYFKNNCQLDIHNCGINTEEYFRIINLQLENMDQIMIATGDTNINIETALYICRLLKENKIKAPIDIIVCVYEDTAAIKLMSQKYKNIRFIMVPKYEIIGAIDENSKTSYKYMNMINRSLDKGAIGQHEDYLKRERAKREKNKVQSEKLQKSKDKNINKVEKEITWDELDVFTRDSNRAVAFDYDNKKIMYQRIIDMQKCRNITHIDKNRIIEYLAEYEHQRWMAFHYAHGWQILPQDQLDGDKWKEKSAKRHLCLVEWDELDNLPISVNEFKEYDRDVVRKIIKAYGD